MGWRGVASRDVGTHPFRYKWFWQGSNPHDPACCFSDAQRLHMLNSLIRCEANDGVQLRVDELQAADVVTRFFPLHDQSTLEYLRREWAKPWQAASGHGWMRRPFYQDIDTIRDYYGLQIAFYFEWLGFYTKWLLAPTILGVIIYFGQEVLHTGGSFLFLEDVLVLEHELELYPFYTTQTPTPMPSVDDGHANVINRLDILVHDRYLNTFMKRAQLHVESTH